MSFRSCLSVQHSEPEPINTSHNCLVFIAFLYLTSPPNYLFNPNFLKHHGRILQLSSKLLVRYSSGPLLIYDFLFRGSFCIFRYGFEN